MASIRPENPPATHDCRWSTAWRGRSAARSSITTPARREVYVAGVYTGTGGDTYLLRVPDWTRIAGHLDERRPVRRILDMRTGLVHHDLATRARPGPCRFVRVARSAGHRRSPSRRSRSSAPKGRIAGAQRRVESAGSTGGPGRTADDAPARCDVQAAWRSQRGIWNSARAGTAASSESSPSERSGGRTPSEASARSFLAAAEEVGFDGLLAEQRSVWAARWADADIRIEGDLEMQRAIRFALFELMAHAPERREAAIGARGLTGIEVPRPRVLGHGRLRPSVPRGHQSAGGAGDPGIPGPPSGRCSRGRQRGRARRRLDPVGIGRRRTRRHSRLDHRCRRPSLHVLTGKHELHIVSDVAWAAATYADWTGDRAFASGPGSELLTETARFWASRFERAADGSAHLSG